MTRLILTNQDLSGQTIVGQPHSYVGNCTGTDIKFTGDWRYVSLYQNTFLRPDWSQAQTRGSYSRFNAFTDIVGSPDLEPLDHEMMPALILSNLSKLRGGPKVAGQLIADRLAQDKAERKYIVSWVNLAPLFLEAAGTRAEELWRVLMGGREHLVQHFLQTCRGDPTHVTWDDSVLLNPPDGGVLTSDWGIAARNSEDGRTYIRHWSELPLLTNPHDRMEMAERLETEIEAATGQQVTLIVVSLLPWRCAVRGRDQGRLP